MNVSACCNRVPTFCGNGLTSIPSACSALWPGTSRKKGVEMPPKLYLLVELGMELLGCRVDVVRMHRNLNAFLKNEIEKDGIYVILSCRDAGV